MQFQQPVAPQSSHRWSCVLEPLFDAQLVP
jgi:hypothetical protein